MSISTINGNDFNGFEQLSGSHRKLGPKHTPIKIDLKFRQDSKHKLDRHVSEKLSLLFIKEAIFVNFLMFK